MVKFTEFIVEGLTYKVDLNRVKKFKNLDDYDKETKGSVTLYSKDGKAVFSYDEKTKKLTVIKHAWQLMNLERGY